MPLSPFEAVAISAFIAAALFVLSGYAPEVEPGQSAALQKSNRLILVLSTRAAQSRLGLTSAARACTGMARNSRLALSVQVAGKAGKKAVRNEISNRPRACLYLRPRG